jgi:hypothetical protein
MMPVMEELKVLGLGSEMPIAAKPLGPEEPSVIGIIETLHSSITPRFSYRDEDHLDPQKQTHPQDNAKGTGVAIASPKTELVVDLKKVGHTHGLPTADQAQRHGVVVFCSLGVKKDSVTRQIHDIERIETPIVFDVSWPEQVRLMDVVDPQGLSEIRVFHPFGDIGSFF